MPLTVEQCREVVEAFKATAPVAAETIYFRVGASQEDLYGAQATVARVGVIFGGYEPGEHEWDGRRYRGRCDLAAANFREPDHVLATLRHEIYGHFGLNTLERTEKRRLLRAIAGTRPDPAFADVWRHVDAAYGDRSELHRAEEVFCHFAERAAPARGHRAATGLAALNDIAEGRLRTPAPGDLEAIATLVAVGIRDRTRAQVIFPTASGLQFQSDGRGDGYAVRVAAEVIRQLAEGTAPWVRTWRPGALRMPFNPVTGRGYRGMNALLLMMQDRRDPRWLTRRQAEAHGAHLRAGEAGRDVQLQYFRFTAPEAVQLARPRVMSFWVYNGEQFEGLPAEARRPQRGPAPHAEAERLIAASGVEIRHAAGDTACYDAGRDQVVVPPREQFATADGYYATVLHELGHATGHASRLGRDLAHPFGSEGYAREELRAGIASLMIGGRLGIGHDPGRHAAYVAAWIRVLETDPRAIFRAAADAEAISGFLLLGQGRALAPERAEAARTPHASRAAAGEAARLITPTPLEDPMRPHPSRRYVAIPFRERGEAKAAAEAAGIPLAWDRNARAWWTEDSPAALSTLGRWTSRAAPSPALPAVEFGDVLRAAGFRLDGPAEMDGRIHRVPLERDRRGDLTGAYCGYEDDHPAGWYRDMSAGTAVTWTWSGAPNQLTDAERRAQAAQAQARQAERERARQAVEAAVVDRLEALLAQSPPAPDDHPYLVAKGVGPGGLLINRTGPVALPPGAKDAQRFSGRGQLLAAYRDIDGRLMGVQSISAGPGRNKSLPKGARLAGGMHLIGDPARSVLPIVVVEGWATGKTLSEATGAVVAVAFSAGNLAAVAEALKRRHPDRQLIIAGDNDHAKSGVPGPDGRPRGNPGLEAAQAAAARVGGEVLLPQFGAGSMGSDWNDLFREDRSGFEGQLSAGLSRLAAGADIRRGAWRDATAPPERAGPSKRPTQTHPPIGSADPSMQR